MVKIWLCRDNSRSLSGMLAVGTRPPLMAKESGIWYTASSADSSSMVLWGKQLKALLGTMRPGTIKELRCEVLTGDDDAS
jgi:hypothetical protein